MLSGPYEIAIAVPDDYRLNLDRDEHGTPVEPDRYHLELARLARWHAPPGAVVVVGRSDQPGVPLLASRPPVDGRPTAYVCRGFVCDRPVTAEADLVALLGAGAR
jgi:uncharacterized protein YyaL (SSP411 family)